MNYAEKVKRQMSTSMFSINQT